MEVICDGLTPTVCGNEIKFFDSEEDEIFKIASPFVMDAAGETTSDIALQLVPTAELELLEAVGKQLCNPNTAFRRNYCRRGSRSK